MKFKKIFPPAIIITASICLIGCGKKDAAEKDESKSPFDFYGVEIGDSKSDVIELCGEPTDQRDTVYLGYDDLDPIYDCILQRISYTLNDSNNVQGILGAWTTDTGDAAQDIYNTIIEKCIDEYGDSYDDTHGDEVTERCIWETPEYRAYVVLMDNRVEMEYTDYEERNK